MKAYFKISLTAAIFFCVIGQAKNYAPTIDGDTYAFASEGGLCGSFKTTPKGNKKLLLEIHRFDHPLLSFVSPRDQGMTLQIKELSNQGQTITYDWAGVSSDSYYKLFCFQYDAQNNYQRKKCSDLITIDSVRHNISCLEK